MTDLIVDHHHPMSATVLDALREGRDQGEETPRMMARAARAVILARGELSISDAYALVDQVWVR